jgi:site-specific DNA recombinase
MKTAALYARVSTRHQEQEATIESQIAQLMGYAQQQGYVIPTDYQFIDQAISGDQLARPGLDRLRDTAMTGELQMMLCLSPDRLARNLGIQHMVLGELRRCGVEVIFLNQPSLGDGPQEQLLLNIQGAFAEYERTVISDRMRRGRLHRLRQGQSVPWPAPYGYHYQAATTSHQSTWKIEQAKAAIVGQIFERYTEDGLSLTALANQLNAQSIPSPQGKQWSSTTLGRLLRQPAYQGTAYFSRSQADYSGLGLPRRQGQGRLRFPRYLPRPVDEWIGVPVPAIVSQTIWQAAQERLERNALLATRNNRTNTYLLRGLLVCDVCGRTLQGRAQLDFAHR